MTDLHFAQISDIHLSLTGDHHDVMAGHAAGFLEQAVAHLSQIPDLDFVLFSGDLLDTGSQAELDRVRQRIDALSRPYYVIPGNHDRSSPRREGLTRRRFAEQFNPQIEARPAGPEAQAGYWSIAVSPEVQLVGLDSIRDKDWGGEIDVDQIAWLKEELARQTDKLVVLAVHHPLHPLAPIDSHPDWTRFVCDNGPEVLALLDKAPQVKVVLTGHHHLCRVDRLGARIHLACPALSIYPCAYRTIRLSRRPDLIWQIEWQTHPAASDMKVAKARERVIRGWQSIGFEARFVEEFARLMLGTEQDRTGSAVL